jgi:hypothetical protein
MRARRNRCGSCNGHPEGFRGGCSTRITLSAARTTTTAATNAPGRRGGGAAFLIYLGLSMLFFGRAVSAGLSSFYVGDGPDPPQSIWFLAWWAHALANRINPLFTHALWAPGGFNLAWTTNIPLAAWLMLPARYAFH